MPSPETQRVIDESIEVLVQNTDTKKPEEFRANLRALVANDRQHIHTSLVAAVEGIKADSKLHSSDPERSDEYISRKQVLTIINSIFKE